MSSYLRFPRGSAGCIRKNVCLAADPHPYDVELLKFECPVGHLLAPTSVVELRLRKQIVLVDHVYIGLKSFDELFEPHDSLPQGEELSFHR